MIKPILITAGMCFSGIAFVSAQNTFPWPSSSAVGIGTTVLAPNAQLSLTGGGINIGASQPADASLHIRDSYGGFDRLTQIHTNVFNKPALNLMGSTNSTSHLWWAWGALSSGSWAIQPGTEFVGNKGFFIDRSGNVGIGISTPSELLAVNGKVRAHEVKVETAGWPDYVFDEVYQLSPLEDLEKYIKSNKHLPGIPTANQVAKDGIALGDMNRKLLEKLEEVMLHLIEKDKEIKLLQQKVLRLEARP